MIIKVVPKPGAGSLRMSNWDDVTISEAQVAWLAMDRGEWQEAADRLKLALGTIDAHRLHDYVFSLPAFARAARLALHHGDVKEAHRQLARAMRARARPPPTFCRTLPSGCGCT